MRKSLLGLLIACGGSNPTTSTRPVMTAAPVAAVTPTEIDCADLCTDYALCWEEHHPGEDFRGGGECVASCEETSQADRAVRKTELGKPSCGSTFNP